MEFHIVFTTNAKTQLFDLEKALHLKKQYKAVLKTIALMATNLRHPSLNTHKYTSLKGFNGEEVFESYAENHTPGAYRIFWHYGPNKQQITIISIVQHP